MVKQRRWPALALVALAAQLIVALPARAQDPEATTQEVRIRQLEAEVRALQRQVFPGGDVGAASLPPPGAQGPVAGPTTGMLTRMDSLEAQVARLTAQYEELSNHVRGIDARLSSAAPAPEQHVARPPLPTPLIEKPAPAPVAAKPSSSRVAAVKAIVKPETGDAGEDEYTYGFKLWQAKFYPESEQQLQLFLEKYPRHARATYARNLIGRALLDDGNPHDAAKWFLKNYEANRHGERAPDSMLFLAEAMVAIKDTSRACIALSEFSHSYAGEAKGRLHSQYEQIRGSVTCN